MAPPPMTGSTPELLPLPLYYLIYSHNIIVIVLVNRSRRRLGRSVIHNLHDVTI